MRVLQVVRQLGAIGGIQTYVAGLTRHLAADNHQCIVLVDDEAECEAASTLERVPALANHISGRAESDALISAILRHRPDVLLVHANADAGLLRAAVESGVPTAAFVHTFACSTAKVFRRRDTVCSHPIGTRCLWDWYAGPCGSSPNPLTLVRTHRQGRSYVAGLRTLNAVFVATNFMKEYVAGEGVDPNKITVEPWTPGLSSDVVGDQGGDATTPEVRRTSGNLAFVGRLTYDKGIHHLIAAMGMLSPEFTLRVVGDGWYRSSLVSQVDALGLADRIQFVGPKSGRDLSAEYARASVVVVPSVLPEPWGLVVGEASASGATVVVSDVGGLPEWQKWSPNVLTCPPGQPARLADAIRSATGMNLRSDSRRVHANLTLPDAPRHLIRALRDLAVQPSTQASIGGAM